MLNLTTLLNKAKKSPTVLKLLNYGLARKIPFNKPHSFKILEVGEDYLTIFLPYKKANLNHIKGLHACALATLSEFTTGLTLLRTLNVKKYRIILKTLKMEYYYQGKSGATATFSLPEDWVEKRIKEPLELQDATTVMLEVKTHDTKSNHLCTGFIEWQIKSWSKVKTKV